MRKLSTLPAFCESAETFWSANVLPADPDRVILVEMMGQDMRVAVRSLTIANAIRRIEPARIVVYAGADAEWSEAVWTYYDFEELSALAQAYGADEVVDIHAVVDARVAGNATTSIFAGVDVGGTLPESAIDADNFERTVDATVARLARVPRVDDSPELQERRTRTRRRSQEFANIYDAVMAQAEVVAVVSSHVDYDNFGLAVEAATRRQVPVLFPQATGSLKAYAIFPEDVVPGEPVRAPITRAIGEFFEKNLWSNRELLRRPAELTIYRAKQDLGTPSWWRGRRPATNLSMRDRVERSAVRRRAAASIGLDADRPTVTVFNHGVSDALWTNYEVFSDLGAWFEHTAELATTRPEVNWLFLDHPLQKLYDGSGFFGRVAERHAGSPWMHFHTSSNFSRNTLFSLTDTVLTVRGSVSNEYPAFGIPAIQAGWSEWSDCGFVSLAKSEDDYDRLVMRHVDALLSGERMITEEQVRRARLWAWYYRSASDVSTPLVPTWNLGQGDPMLNAISHAMKHPESDADPGFVAVRRLWKRHEPFLTRLDWSLIDDDLVDAFAPLGALR